MSPAEIYRAKAIQFAAFAADAKTAGLQVSYAQMSQAYFRLAAMAEANQKTDIVYETPPPARADVTT
jgi:hypothetical protein